MAHSDILQSLVLNIDALKLNNIFFPTNGLFSISSNT